MGAKMDAIAGKPPVRKILMPVNDSPESKAALVWAVENLIRHDDQGLLYNMVKTPTLIPTAMGMVPYSGASPAMQKAHIVVASADGTKLLHSFQAYCKNKKIDATVEVGRCDKRHVELLRKGKEEAASLLVMGTGGSPRFGLRLGKKQTLSARICQDADCHVILVDKKKHPSVHAKTPTVKSVDDPVATSNSLSSPGVASKPLGETSKQIPVALPSEPQEQVSNRLRGQSSPHENPHIVVKRSSVALSLESGGGNSTSRERLSPRGPPNESSEQPPVALSSEAHGQFSNSREQLSSQRGGLVEPRANLSLEIPSEIVLGELATPDSDVGPADSKYAPTATLVGTLKYSPSDPTSPASTACSGVSRSPQKSSDPARTQPDGSRTWSQTLQLLPLPKSDAEGEANTDADAESDGKVGGKATGAGKGGGKENGVGKQDGKGIGTEGGTGNVDEKAARGADACEDVEEYAAAVADVEVDARSPPLGREGGSDLSAPVGFARPGIVSPGEWEGRPRSETPFGEGVEPVGRQPPSPYTATVRHAKPPPRPPVSPVCSPRREHQPGPSAKALINRVFQALNEQNFAGSIEPDSPSNPPEDPTLSHMSPDRSPSPRGIAPRKLAPADGCREPPVVDIPSIWTLIEPQAAAPPVFGPLPRKSSDGPPASAKLLPNGPSPYGRRASAEDSCARWPDFRRISAGKVPEVCQLSAGHLSDVRRSLGRRTSAGQSPDARRAFREIASDGRRKSVGHSPDGRRTSDGPLGRPPAPVKRQGYPGADAVIAQLREQVDLLTEIGNLRDREFENVASRAKVAEKAAQERERALLTEKLMREEAEVKARLLADRMAAIRVRALRANPGVDRMHLPPHR